MSLVKKPVLTSRKLTANQLNGLERRLLSRVSLDRIAAAQMRHGFYSKTSGEAIRALGEDPADFNRLFSSLVEVWAPSGEYEQVLLRRLARALWRLERADHIQEAMAVCQAEMVARKLQEQVEAEDARHQRTIAALERLLESVQQTDFSVIPPELEALQEVYGPKPLGRPRQILYRVFRLRPATEGATLALPSGGGKLEPAQGEERMRLRDELCSLVRQEIDASSAAYVRRQEKRTAELSPALRDSCLASDHPRADFMLRAENSAFRQVERLTQLLIKVQKDRKATQRRAYILK